VALQEQADVLPDGAIDLVPEATDQPQAATSRPEGMLVRKRGIDGAESLPVKKSKGKAKALDKDGDEVLTSDHCHLSCVLQEFNAPGDHGYKSDEYSSLFNAMNHIILAEFSAIGQVEHQCLGLPPDQLCKGCNPLREIFLSQDTRARPDVWIKLVCVVTKRELLM
jgi:hypothetical protein